VSRRTPWVVAAVMAAAGACLTACVQVPSNGPVVQTQQSVQASPNQNPDNNPPPPRAGMSPTEVVNGFLEAMTATPLQTSTAQQFLTTAGRALWQPRSVIAYTGLLPQPRGSTTVNVGLRDADLVGPAGHWVGRLTPAASQVSFPMRKEGGEWRIDEAPNALLVPVDFYDQTFQDASLYFFDPSARVLVPEVVHVPQGQQLTTSLAQALVLGPRGALDGVVRSFIPPGLTASPVVVRNGVAEVSLDGRDPGPTSRRTNRLMVAQLAWTLRQDPSVKAITLTLAGRQVTDASGSSTFRVDAPEITRFDPAWPRASSQLYGLRRGRLVSGQANRLTPVGGPFGTSRLGVGAFAVSLDDSTVAATTGLSLLVGPVRGAVPPTEVLAGRGVLRPAWDFDRRLWALQNRSGGALVLSFVRGHAREVRVPGVTDEDVRLFIVSRDGSRLVAVVRGPDRDRVVVSRIRYDEDGQVVSGTPARAVRWATGTSTRIRDVGWTSPTTLAVLDQVTNAQAEVRLLDVDGSTDPSETPPIVVPGRVLSLATSPIPAGDAPPFAVQPGELFNLAQVDTTVQQPVPGLHFITYAG
jgi:hypothetical protein